MGTILLPVMPKKTGINQESEVLFSIVFNTISSLSSLHRSYHRSAYHYGYRRFVR